MREACAEREGLDVSRAPAPQQEAQQEAAVALHRAAYVAQDDELRRYVAPPPPRQAHEFALVGDERPQRPPHIDRPPAAPRLQPPAASRGQPHHEPLEPDVDLAQFLVADRGEGAPRERVGGAVHGADRALPGVRLVRGVLSDIVAGRRHEPVRFGEPAGRRPVPPVRRGLRQQLLDGG